MTQDTVDRLSGIAIATAVAIIVVTTVFIAVASGEVTMCSDSSSQGRVLYRYIQGQKCWFAPELGMRRGREKPASELAWPDYRPFAPEPIPTDLPPWAKPDVHDPSGWSHKE